MSFIVEIKIQICFNHLLFYNLLGRLNSDFLRSEGYASKFDLVKYSLLLVAPKLARMMGITLAPTGTVEFFADIMKQTVQHRK